MIDREKVIKGWECHMEAYTLGCADCPYRGRTCNFADTLYKDVYALLKKQEAVKPEREHSGGGTTWWNVCGNCKTAINPNDKFCHECGKPILWEGR